MDRINKALNNLNKSELNKAGATKPIYTRLNMTRNDWILLKGQDMIDNSNNLIKDYYSDLNMSVLEQRTRGHYIYTYYLDSEKKEFMFKDTDVYIMTKDGTFFNTVLLIVEMNHEPAIEEDILKEIMEENIGEYVRNYAEIGTYASEFKSLNGKMVLDLDSDITQNVFVNIGKTGSGSVIKLRDYIPKNWKTVDDLKDLDFDNMKVDIDDAIYRKLDVVEFYSNINILRLEQAISSRLQVIHQRKNIKIIDIQLKPLLLNDISTDSISIDAEISISISMNNKRINKRDIFSFIDSFKQIDYSNPIKTVQYIQGLEAYLTNIS